MQQRVLFHSMVLDFLKKNIVDVLDYGLMDDILLTEYETNVTLLSKLGLNEDRILTVLDTLCHVAERLQLAPGSVQTRHDEAFEYVVVGSAHGVEPDLVEKPAIDEVGTHQPQLVLADASHDRAVFGRAVGRKQRLAELLLVRPLAGLPLKNGQHGLIAAAAERLLDSVPAVGLGHDLDGRGPALVMLQPDKHATKVVICRGTPKSTLESVSHRTLRRIFRQDMKKVRKTGNKRQAPRL